MRKYTEKYIKKYNNKYNKMKPIIMRKIKIQIIDERGEARIDYTFDSYEAAINELEIWKDQDYIGDL